MNKELERIFKQGSKTYSTSSLFFPESVRDDVVRLYAFVRTADDFVDEIPADPKGFLQFANLYRNSLRSGPADDLVIDSFIDLSRRYCLDEDWAEAFLKSMEWDLHINKYRTMAELIEYMVGSAEVIGLFMARILGLPEEADRYAQMQGRAMQLINFIRDIHEDQQLGREYLPEEDRRPGLLYQETANRYPMEFKQYIRDLIQVYREWQAEAQKGYKFIPRRYLIPIKTAADMYVWTARAIEKDPFIVFERKVKPGKVRIFWRVFLNTLSAGRGGCEHAQQNARSPW